jgi:hypothetical protein
VVRGESGEVEDGTRDTFCPSMTRKFPTGEESPTVWLAGSDPVRVGAFGCETGGATSCSTPSLNCSSVLNAPGPAGSSRISTTGSPRSLDTLGGSLVN